MALFTVKATVWFDVADGCEFDNVSDRELACAPGDAGLNAATIASHVKPLEFRVNVAS